jgi:hypothetical protein
MEHARGLGTVTEEMVTRRARELAETNSRPEGKPTPSDWNQAKEELMGGEHPAMDVGTMDVPSSKRWDPVPGTTGHRVDQNEMDDEQTFAERLVNEGNREAEHERMVEASRDTRADKDLDQP